MTRQRPLRILVVDDDPAMVGAITALVGTEGHHVITAYDGHSALRRFREENPDLILLDLAMPGPDGIAVVNELRAAGSPPIIVVSGESGSPSKVRALQLGADFVEMRLPARRLVHHAEGAAALAQDVQQFIAGFVAVQQGIVERLLAEGDFLLCFGGPLGTILHIPERGAQQGGDQ